MPDLPRRRRPRRPVRRLRQRARPRRADQPRLQDQRRNPALRGDRTLLPRPAGARRGEPRVAQDPQGLAHQRHQLLHRPVQGSQAPRHHARHRLGHPRTGGGMDRQSEQEVVRVVRRGDRLPVGLHRMGPPPRRPGEVARVVERPELPGLLLHGQGQHHLPHPDLALRDACLQRQGFQGRRDR